MSFSRAEQEWEYFADTDPFWAIIGTTRAPGKRDVDEFFLSGEKEIQRVVETAVRLGLPIKQEKALDFGCGVGRLTRGLAKYFNHCFGIDIAATMISRAKELNQSFSNCNFTQNTSDDLQLYPNEHFDMVYSSLVLQHIPSKRLIKSYVSEFLRVLKQEGLLVFQLPNHIPIKHRVQPRRRTFALLKFLGLSERFLFHKLKLHPMRMNFIAENEMVKWLNMNGAKVLEIQTTTPSNSTMQNSTYFVAKKRLSLS